MEKIPTLGIAKKWRSEMKTFEQIKKEAMSRVTKEQVDGYEQGEDLFGFGLKPLTEEEIKEELIRADAIYINETAEAVKKSTACFDPCL